MNETAGKKAIVLFPVCNGGGIKDQVIKQLIIAESGKGDQAGDDNNNKGNGQGHKSIIDDGIFRFSGSYKHDRAVRLKLILPAGAEMLKAIRTIFVVHD